METLALLETLTSIPAISGFERTSELPQALSKILEKHHPVVDSLGNVIIKIGSGKKRILIEAHLDEVGFLKTPSGFVSVGSISEENIDEKQIVVGNGERISFFRRGFERTGTLVKSPALDNRTGCTALLLLPALLKDVDAEITLAWTVKEETSKEGILKVYRNIRPKIVISVDSAYAQPFEQQRWQVPECGRGPAIQIQGPDFAITQYALIESAAKKKNIPYQFEIVDSKKGGTNLCALVGEDIERFQINIPVRYQHTSMSETDIRDIENAALLVEALVKELTQNHGSSHRPS